MQQLKPIDYEGVTGGSALCEDNSLSKSPVVSPEISLVDRHVVWLKGPSLAYFRVPKAANTSIRHRLADGFKMPRIDGRRPQQDRFWVEQSADLAETLTPAHFTTHPDTDAVWSFTFVRHPVSRVYSCWNNKLRENDSLGKLFRRMGVTNDMSFDAFVEIVAQTDDSAADVHVRSLSHLLVHKGRLLPHFIGRIENIGPDWDHARDEIRIRTGTDLGELGRKNVRMEARPEVARGLDQGTLARIKSRFREDFERFYPDDAD